ncbi:NUDIX domain-containing protein [Nocardia crassostreae]|uniref:NUDIX domain-containing protein n=1 Tax=Nocardia crassostreae TaxID=53428 RepID=UPI000A68ED1B|nr:NUDIX hydrolase [Nocardia crassostreae]
MDNARADYFATLPRKRMGAGVLFVDDRNRVLLVEPTYKDYWELPGGVVEADESPRTAATREITEELALTITPGRLLVLDWVPPGPYPTDGIMLLFDGGLLPPRPNRRHPPPVRRTPQLGLVRPHRLRPPPPRRPGPPRSSRPRSPHHRRHVLPGKRPPRRTLTRISIREHGDRRSPGGACRVAWWGPGGARGSAGAVSVSAESPADTDTEGVRIFARRRGYVAPLRASWRGPLRQCLSVYRRL